MPKFDTSHYIDCQSRINRFWSEYPEGAINTALVSDPNNYDRVVFRADIFKQRPTDTWAGTPDATGYAAEERADDPRGGANFTNWHENGETSAIGRALANMGYATSLKDRPSREEMDKANRGWMQGASNGPAAQVNAAPGERVPGGVSNADPNAATERQVKAIWAMGLKVCGTTDKLHELVKEKTGKEHIDTGLTKADASKIIEHLNLVLGPGN